MNSWFVKHIGDGMWAPMVSAEIEETFQSLFESAGKPVDMAIFVRREKGDVHCEVTAYFSPEAGNVADLFDALPCVRPSCVGLELLAGDENCWTVLFPQVET